MPNPTTDTGAPIEDQGGLPEKATSAVTSIVPAEGTTVAGSEGGLQSNDEKVAVQDEVPETAPAKPAKGKWTIWAPLSFGAPPPPPATLDDAPMLGLAQASWLSKLTFWWITPILVLGYKRELEATDLPKMDPSREAAHLADVFEAHFHRRRADVEEWNRRLDAGEHVPTAAEKLKWKALHKVFGIGRVDGRRSVGLALALSDTFGWDFWSAGIFKVIGDLAQTTTPLVTKQLIYFVQDAGYASQGVEGYAMPAVGRGVGFAFLLFFMQLVASICTAQTFSRSGQVGILARGALISSVYRKAMVLSGKSRQSLSNSKLVNHISTDISRIDFCSSFFHFSYTCVFQLVEVIVILLCTIGVSSLAGVAVVFVALPLQSYAMRKLFQGRQASLKHTDARIKIISELLLGIKTVKLFAWEKPMLGRVHDIRRREMVEVRKLLIIRAANLAVALSIPLLASVVTFAVYSATGHSQNPAQIWTSISLLNLLRMPLMLLPNSLSTITDAYSALQRLTPVFMAEELPETFLIDREEDMALVVKDASFEWEAGVPDEAKGDKGKKGGQTKKSKDKAEKEKDDAAAAAAAAPIDPPASLSHINLAVPRGQLVAVVGPVGSGKSTLLQSLIGECRKIEGTVRFGGSIGYCPQSAWVTSSTIRSNILFGREFDEDRYWEVVRAACLLSDLDSLPYGDATEVGEKGITLSGGQRQRVSIARTLYYNADIVLMDDPLSAVDAHVGAHIFDNVIKQALRDQGKTVVLVTHALHFLPQVDQILCLENGTIAERGSYDELMAANGTFAKLSNEFGRIVEEEKGEADATVEDGKTDRKADGDKAKAVGLGVNAAKMKDKGLMQKDERTIGAVGGSVYLGFAKAANGKFTIPFLALTMALMATSQTLSQFWLVWWQTDRWGLTSNMFIGIYAVLGVATALFTFSMGVASVWLGTTSSRTLHRNAINRVMRAPQSWFDTVPLGAILNRFAKDVDSLDNRLNDAMRMCLATLAQVAGAIITIAVIYPAFLGPVAFVLILYQLTSVFYRASARSIKRHDNVLRSSLYAHFSESLAGLSSIRAFGEQDRFTRVTEERIDVENRAYFLTVVNQRWLAIRLDLMGALLTLCVAAIAVGQRAKISSSKIGLILSTVISIQQAFSMIIRQSTEVENNLASAERLLHYGENLPVEKPALIEETKPDPVWPQGGAIEFRDATMRYRPELPPVLRGLNVVVQPGEKVGVVGRTGAGKSSIMMTLFRICELDSGSILIDGVDIATLGLEQLRSRLSIIPQEATLFKGTIRTNLDPFGDHADAVLWDALKRSWLVEREASADGAGQASRFTLDTAVEDEGANMSVGERSLVSLARALVKDSRIVVMDEATASVDVETDARIQRTVRREFRDKTLLVIAHRLHTVIGSDKILVMDQGKVDSFDTPANLFARGEGIFHSLCVQSGITLEEIKASGFAHLDDAELDKARAERGM